ncbi:MAG TPA: glycoside hydrolase family 2 TIM barrel-domain containing protein [Opitutaceae bacterium]
MAAALLLSPAALGIPLTNVSSPTHYAVAGGADPGRSAFDVAGAGVSVPGYSPVYPLPLIEPEPALVAGLPSFTVSLDGNWQRTPTPSARFWEEKASDRSWTDVAVPFTRFRGGSFQRALEPYAYRREFAVPASFAGHRIILRFENVTGTARLWVNGRFIRQHFGSCLEWTSDITDAVTPGARTRVDLLVDDRPEGLQRFIISGGLLGPVTAFAVPATHLTRFQAEPGFNSRFADVTLFLHLRVSLAAAGTATIRLRLKDPNGTSVPISPDSVTFNLAAQEKEIRIPVSAPQKWEAEHPRLYTLIAAVQDASGQPTEALERKIGFRQIDVVGNRMLINGREVKLRGLWGNSDVAEIKQLNVNHTRQKYVRPGFLDDADRLGLYVLDEVPVDFAKYGVETDPQFAAQWLELISQLMERDRNHPSVIMWGLGNESFDGPNVLNTFHFVQTEDRHRPTLFSWANRVPVDRELPYSVYSVHYPNLNAPNLNLGAYNVALWHSPSLIPLRQPVPVLPVLQDEYAHVPLKESLLLRDPNVRNFWGESIQRFWEKMVATPGALGGDQFGIGLWLGRGNGPGTPEHYLLREAYSPIRIDNAPLANPGRGQPLPISVKNWYDFTNLNELAVAWACGADHGKIAGPDVPAHQAGFLQLPARDWKDGDVVSLVFVDPSGQVPNEFRLTINPTPPRLPTPQGPAPTLSQTPGQFVVAGPHFQVVFDRYRGLMQEASHYGQTLIVDGPFLDLAGSGLAWSEWRCDSMDAHLEGGEAVIDIRGNYAVFLAHFQVRIDGTGLITTRYWIDHVPGSPAPPIFSPWNETSVGGYSEVGVSYMLPKSADRLSWRRRALWSTYPADHIGRPVGLARREPPSAPSSHWAEREDPAGAGTNDWRAMKEHIESASVWTAGSSAALTALSDGRDAVRLAVDPGSSALTGGVRLSIDNDWNYEDLGLGNYARPPLRMGDGYSNTVYLRIGDAPATGERIAPKPLFRDPIGDGASDPTVIWNPTDRKWFMFYTSRRANAVGLGHGVEWVHGTPIGIATSADGGVTWKYLREAHIDFPGAVADPTFWAPCVVEDRGTYHMFVTYVPGIFGDWNHPRTILHLTSSNLIDWTYVATLPLAVAGGADPGACDIESGIPGSPPPATATKGVTKVIDPGVLHLPDGTWRLWYKDEATGSSCDVADSPDLYQWTDHGRVPGLSDRSGEAPVAFHWKGHYWLLRDIWQGLALYRSEDASTWKRVGTLLDQPGTGADDAAVGHHPDVILSGDRAHMFYFVQPGGRRSSLQVVELNYDDAQQTLTADRDRPCEINLQPPLDPESQSKYN